MEVMGLKDENITVVFFPLVMVISPGEEVCLLVGGAWLMVEGEVILSQLGDPSCLSSVELLGFSEVLEVLMICPDFYLLCRTHQVMSPFGQGEHDGE